MKQRETETENKAIETVGTETKDSNLNMLN
jgi:hypothetical protein